MRDTPASRSSIRRPRKRTALALTLIATVTALVSLATPASATWSIVAVDTETGEVGVALASCVAANVLGDSDKVLVPAVLVPGRGAGIAQGTLNLEAPETMRILIEDGATPTQVVEALTAADFEEQPSIRQYGVVTLPTDDRPAEADSHTGESAGAFAVARPWDGGRAVVSVQGVLMADELVADEALLGFEAEWSNGSSLTDSLAAGLAAGSAIGGDRRCDEQTALFAHVAVAGPDEDGLQPEMLLTVTVDEGDGQNPVPLLIEALDQGRTGWIDQGANRPAGIPRLLVLGIGVVLAVAAFFVFRAGMGTPSARR